jgi:hypothetical protein
MESNSAGRPDGSKHADRRNPAVSVNEKRAMLRTVGDGTVRPNRVYSR